MYSYIYFNQINSNSALHYFFSAIILTEVMMNLMNYCCVRTQCTENNYFIFF